MGRLRTIQSSNLEVQGYRSRPDVVAHLEAAAARADRNHHPRNVRPDHFRVACNHPAILSEEHPMGKSSCGGGQ